MRRRIVLRTFLLDLGSLALGMGVASFVIYRTPFPWEAPTHLVRPPFTVYPMLGLLFGGLAAGSWLTARTLRAGVPRPSYGRAVTIAVFTFTGAAVATFVARDAFYYSRPFIGLSAAVMLVLGLLHRSVARARPWSEPMLVITREKKLVEDLMNAPHVEVLATFDPAGEEPPPPPDPGVTIVVDLRAVLSEPMAQFVSSSNLAGIPIRSLVNVYEEHTGRLAIVHLAEGWELRTPVERSSGYATIKPILDVVVVLLVSPVALLLGLLAAVAIKLDSPGPVIFRQPRVGKGGVVFTAYKFRTMHTDAERDGPRFASVDDPRTTRVGRVLRRFRIDELPQLWNVLKGDLSLVGPRPEQPAFVEHFRKTIPFYDHRHLVRPGITGWAQVNYGYADDEADTVEKLTYDLYYVKHMSLWLDLHVLGKTVWTVLSGFGAR